MGEERGKGVRKENVWNCRSQAGFPDTGQFGSWVTWLCRDSLTSLDFLVPIAGFCPLWGHWRPRTRAPQDEASHVPPLLKDTQKPLDAEGTRGSVCPSGALFWRPES